MLIVDALIAAFEKHGIDKLIVNDDMAQAIASDAAINYQEEDRTSLWSTEAKELLNSCLEHLKLAKEEVGNFDHEDDNLAFKELGVLIFKIEEVLLKNK